MCADNIEKLIGSFFVLSFVRSLVAEPSGTGGLAESIGAQRTGQITFMYMDLGPARSC